MPWHSQKFLKNDLGGEKKIKHSVYFLVSRSEEKKMMCRDLELKMTLGIISFFFFNFTTEIEVLINVSLT